MKKILVTGGAGFLGSYICEELLKRKYEVVAIDMADGEKIAHLMTNKRFTFIQDSVCDTALMKHQMKDIDMVFHLAAIADPLKYVTNPLNVMEVDLLAAINIFKIAAENRIKIIFSSTSEVFGRNKNVPWNEEDDRVLGSTEIYRWCYSTSKSACEHYLFALHKQEKIPFVIYRFFNVYGPKLDDLGHGRVIPIFLKQFLNGEDITVHGDGRQTRTFVYVDDAIDAVIKLAFSKKAENQVFNIGTSREYSMHELAKTMKKIGNFKSKIKFVEHKKVFGKGYEDIPRRVPDVSKLKKYINWQARVSLEKGLKKTIEYYRNRKGI
ncbi:MAG: NAD-dependent epimerase/dehydratase family protein [Candidatus Omnitrophica bacterium]|nr:NAD-dependent epimerase/dehydratase family protein [Candidatus Omnitrophota bacterium]MBU4149822.1 NAD-dependent epimerase/dehydratase family protein [Candidatus Omnitrophota bacterium]